MIASEERLGIAGERDHVDLPLDPVAQNIVVNTHLFERPANDAHFPVRPIAVTVAIGIFMPNKFQEPPHLLKQFGIKVIMPPSTREAHRLEQKPPADLQPVVNG